MNFWPFKRKSALGHDEVLAAIAAGGHTLSGKNVTHKTALQVAVAFCCARVISEGVAQVPFKLFLDDGTNKKPATDHPLYDLLFRMPNDSATSFQWRETFCFQTVFTGDSFSFINRGRRGEILELTNLEPSKVEVRDPEFVGGRPKYFVSGVGGEQKEFPAEAILHIKGPSWDGVVGLDAVKIAREAIGLSKAVEDSHARMHANGVKSGGLLSVEGKLSTEQYDQLNDWVQKNFQGVNAFNTMILDRAASFTQMSMSGVDAQHIETRRYQIEEVCRFFRVMPLMVMQADKASTYASAEQMFLAHVVHTLAPWYERIEQSIDTQLLTKQERADGYYVKFITQGLLRGALKDTAEYLSKLSTNGIITRNEARALLELNPLEGLDEPLTPVNLTGDMDGDNDDE